MEILTKVLGIETKFEPWNHETELPLYIADCYHFQGIRLDGHRCILLTPTEEMGTIPSLKKQIERIQELDAVPVIFLLEKLSSYRRKSLIENRMPFLTEKQAYLPFMGTYLEKKSKEPEPLDKFMMSTQFLVLLYIYSQQKKMYLSDAAKVLPFSAMTMSRAVKQLDAADLFYIGKDGTRIVLESKFDRKALYDRAKKYMSSPVLKKGYIDKQNLTEDMVPAGITALAEKTMLNENTLKTYAVNHKKFDSSLLMPELVEPDRQAEIEIWKYEPKYFSIGKAADPVSVALTFEGTGDERIEEAVEEMMKYVWWVNYDQRD